MIDLHAIVQKNRKEAQRHLRDEIRVLEGCKHRNIIHVSIQKGGEGSDCSLDQCWHSSVYS